MSYVPPIGIQTPPFGIDQVTPGGGSTVTSWPTTISAGQHLVLSGTMTSGGTCTASGTALSPCYITTSGVTLSGDFNLLGSYCIIDGLHFTGYSTLGIGGDHNCARNCTSVGTLTDPTGAGFYTTGSNLVFYNCTVSNRGSKTAPVDTDAHGYSAVRGSSLCWFLSCTSHDNAGDGFNVNSYPYDSAGFTAIQGVFFGKCLSYSNKQTGFWCKQSEDVFVSQCESYGHLADPLGFSYGQGMGYQYGTNRIWWIYNNVHDNGVGIGVSGDLGGDPAGAVVGIIHNTFNNCVGTSQCGSGGGVWDCAGVFLTGGGNYFCVDNTITNSNAGYHSTRGAGLSITGAIGRTDVISDTPIVTTVTSAQVYASFKTLYGLDITGGLTPVAGTVGANVAAPPSNTGFHQFQSFTTQLARKNISTSPLLRNLLITTEIDNIEL